MDENERERIVRKLKRRKKSLSKANADPKSIRKVRRAIKKLRDKD